jgi:hypothetical protein
MARAQNMEAKQTFAWVLLSEIEMAPSQWGRPLRQSDVRAIAAAFDPDMIGAVALWSRPDLPAGRGRFVCIDGQHRCAALRLIGYDDQRVPSLIYEGLTMETAAELSLGLQDRRNLHALDKHRAASAAHERRAIEIDKIMVYCHVEFAYQCKASDIGRISAVAAVTHVWDRMGEGLERVLEVCSRAWGGTSAGFASNVLKLVMTVLCAHDGQVDDTHLSETLSVRSPAQWIVKDTQPRRSLSSLAQDVVVEYNKKARGGNRLPEMTPSQYEAAARRPPVPTVKGKIEGRQTTGQTTRRLRRMAVEAKAAEAIKQGVISGD